MVLTCAYLSLKNIWMFTKDIFLRAALLGRGLSSSLANHWAQAKLQLTQEACKLGIKYWTPPLILEKSEQEEKTLRANAFMPYLDSLSNKYHHNVVLNAPFFSFSILIV